MAVTTTASNSGRSSQLCPPLPLLALAHGPRYQNHWKRLLRDASIIILVNYSLQKRADTVGTAVLVFKFSLLIPSLYTRNPIFLQNRLSMNIVNISGI